MSDHAHIVSINVNPAGGVPKYAVESAFLTTQGVRGDKQNDQVHHGGTHRAVSLYSYELIQALQREGHPIATGTTGENLTISGLDWATVGPGTQLAIGPQIIIEITSFATPCSTIEASFSNQAFTRISQKKHPGWSRLYAKIIHEGEVFQGDVVQLIDQE
jgi:MOSC domain-containing protein YiiM